MTSVLDKFDPYAMVKPKTREDIASLIQEALSELAFVNATLDDILKSPPTPKS